MKSIRITLSVILYATLLCLCSLTDSKAQDVVTIAPVHGVFDQCLFNASVKNGNSSSTAIDEVKFVLNTSNGDAYLTPGLTPTGPKNWSVTISDNGDTLDFLATTSAINPGATLSGFLISYDPSSIFDKGEPMTWYTMNQGNVVSSNTFAPICTSFQSYNKIDTATVVTTQKNGDPYFLFTFQNRNDQGGGLGAVIGGIHFQLLNNTNPSPGTVRPSAEVPPDQFWLLDSVNSYYTYFHTEQNALQTGDGKGPFTVGLRANPAVSKYNFVWWAYDDAGTFVDRDTIFNISNTATSTATTNDSVSVAPVGSGCLYQLTLKNYHVANLLPPGPITKLVLRMQTAGVQFDQAPNIPAKWKKVVNADSIVYSVDSIQYGVPSGAISSAFEFSVTGSTTTPFTIGWETDRPQGVVNSGSFSTSCVIQAPRGDSTSLASGSNACEYVLSVYNLHNTPASNIGSVTLSIPAGSGEITGLTSSSADWQATAVSSISTKFAPINGGTAQLPGSSQDLTFQLNPKDAGSPVVVTWQTNDETATKISTGFDTITCTPAPTLCDTVELAGNVNIDSCEFNLNVISRGNASITQVVLTPGNSWLVDSVGTPSNGNWQATIAPDMTSVKFTSETGIAAGQSQAGFIAKFFKCNAEETFPVSAVTTDASSHSCTSSLSFHCSTAACNGVVGDVDPSNQLQNISIVPNPTTTTSDLTFTVPTQQRVMVQVFDALGKGISTNTNRLYSPGTYSVSLDLSTQSSGNYYVRIQSPFGIVTKRIVKQ